MRWEFTSSSPRGFVDKENEAERLSYFPEVTQLVSGWARIKPCQAGFWVHSHDATLPPSPIKRHLGTCKVSLPRSYSWTKVMFPLHHQQGLQPRRLSILCGPSSISESPPCHPTFKNSGANSLLNIAIQAPELQAFSNSWRRDQLRKQVFVSGWDLEKPSEALYF